MTQRMRWTTYRNTLLRDLIEGGNSTDVICERIGCSDYALKSQARKLGLKVNVHVSHAKPASNINKAGVRECLKCHRNFKSHGPGNRICKPCRHANQDLSSRIEPVTLRYF